MRHPCLHLSAALALTFAATVSACEPVDPADRACENPGWIARYHVQHAAPDAFLVEADFAQPTARLDLNSHGSSRKDAQAESVRDLQAFDAAGKPVPIVFAGNGTWEMKQAASRVTYRLVADHDGATWIAGTDEVATRFDHSFFFAGDAFFLIDYDWPALPVVVDFDLPAGWNVTSPWRTDDRGRIAATPDDLGTNVFAMGTDAAHEVDAGGMRVTWLSDTRVQATEPALLPLMERAPRAYTEFWGAAPGDELTVFFLSDPDTDGGAFRHSFAMRFATPLRASERVVWEHTLAHELMHVWMNNANGGVRITGDGSAYWFTEGFTDYLTVKLMRQAGLIDEALANQRIANQVRRYAIGKRLSPDIGLGAAGKEKHRHWELIYGGGAFFALLLDAELSQSSPTAFRDAMRAVQSNPGVAYDNATMLAMLDQHTGGRASAILAQVEKGMTLPQVRAALAPAGVSVEGFASDEVYVSLAPCGSDAPCRSAFLRP
jgi:predicted metalloprotease with PDZ domain